MSPIPQDSVASAAQVALSRNFDCVLLLGVDAIGRLPEADVVVCCMGDHQGCNLLRGWPVERPGRPLVVIVARKDEAQIAACLDAGANDFLVLPLEPEELVIRVKRAASLRLDTPNRSPVPVHVDGLIGRAPAFKRQLARLPIMASCDAGVLITGETGTGKEIFAQAIHYQSARASRPWVAVNCAAIPPELVESELFGHARGAYTNAHAARAGLVREAEKGTLFLDEIDSLPYSAQAKLLRFLQEREFRAVGSNLVHHADVRIIAASNGELATMVTQGSFRQDLYYRLNVLPLALPPLRERRDDIADLARHFVSRFARQFKRAAQDVSPRALRRLEAHAWPGNVRELEHVIERAVLMSSNAVLDEDDLDLDFESVSIGPDESFRAAKSRVVDAFERDYIKRLLAEHDGNVTHAAQAAKKNRRAFFELIRKHKIAAEHFRQRS